MGNIAVSPPRGFWSSSCPPPPSATAAPARPEPPGRTGGLHEGPLNVAAMLAAMAQACGRSSCSANPQLSRGRSEGSARMPARPADYGSRNSSPSSALAHENATPTATARATAPSAPAGPAWKRNPMAAPTPIIRPSTNRLRIASAQVRPARRAARAIGRARKRSIIPLARSSAMATPVWEGPNAIASTKMPGSR